MMIMQVLFLSDEDLSLLLSDLLAVLTDAVGQDDAPVTQVTNAVTSFSWLTKALIMRGHRQTDAWTDKLVGMLSHSRFGSVAAEGFKLIMAQNEEYMNSDNYCNVRLVCLLVHSACFNLLICSVIHCSVSNVIYAQCSESKFSVNMFWRSSLST
jgi:hypothetical protein